MVLKRHSQFRPWPLKGPQGQAPPLPGDDSITFDLNSVPATTDSANGAGQPGKLANYIACLCLTAFGTIKANPATSERITWADMVVALYKSFDLVGAWHGRPIANNNWRAASARIWELIAMGYQSGSRHMAPIFSSEATAQPFRHTLYLPLSLLLGDDPVYSAQLALLFKDAQLNIQTAGVGTVLPNGAAVTELTAKVRCSAVMVPQNAVRLAPAYEWIEYRQTGANANSNQVDMISFGNVTALEGVQPGAAIHTLLAETNAGGVGGAFLADQLTQFSAPFLGITETQHLDPFVQMLEQVAGYGPPRENETQLMTGATLTRAQQAVDISGFPYDSGASGHEAATLDPDLLVFPMLVAGKDLQVTKCPVFDGTQSYFRSLSDDEGGSGVDLTLCGQVKSWSPSKVQDFFALCAKANLFLSVYGTNDVEPITALNDSATSVDIRDTRFLPIEYRPKAKAA